MEKIKFAVFWWDAPRFTQFGFMAFQSQKKNRVKEKPISANNNQCDRVLNSKTTPNRDVAFTLLQEVLETVLLTFPGKYLQKAEIKKNRIQSFKVATLSNIHRIWSKWLFFKVCSNKQNGESQSM